MLNVLEAEIIKIDNLKELLENMMDKFIKSHTISKKAHEQLIAMSHLDSDVADIIKSSEIDMTEKIVTLLENNNFHISNFLEKVHITCSIIDNFCHEVVYHKHDTINYDIMKKEVINIVINILK